jgi:predicted  nucleic acid-binding Zn-ribbon protein
VKADPADQARLLELQELDSALDRSVARRKTLPELATIEQATARLAELRDQIALAEAAVSDIAREQSRLENEVELVRTRAARDQQRLDAGQVSSPRELENLQSEIASLGRRQGDLEDDVLEVMERREGLETGLAKLVAERSGTESERADAERRRDAGFAEIDAEAAATRQQREALAGSLPEALLTLYEKVRSSSGGVGAAALVRRRCSGCHLELAGAELRAAAAAPEDEVLRCEECRRILVRTVDSGL